MKRFLPFVAGLALCGCSGYPGSGAPACTEAAGCGDGERCGERVCEAVPPGSECLTRADCGNGQRCGAAVCAPVPLGTACVEDPDCGNLQRCGDQACVPEPPPGGCVEDAGCGDGEHCVGAACVPVTGSPETCPAPGLAEQLVCTDWDRDECPCYAGPVSFHERDEGGRLSCAGVTGFSEISYLKQSGCHLEDLAGQLTGEAIGFGELRLRVAFLPNDTSCSAQPDVWVREDGEERPAVRITCSATCKVWMQRLPALAEELLVPGGSFEMGTPQALLSPDRPDEGPAYPVEVGCFRMDRFEVSRELYQQCMAAGTCSAPDHAAAGVDARSFFGGDNAGLPITFLTQQQAEAFCKFGDKELPTEAEWERAARSDPALFEPWPWGATPPFTSGGRPDCARAIFEGCGAGPAQVGAGGGNRGRGPSYFGIADLGGNVREWTRDFYQEDAYELRAASSGRAGANNPEQRSPGPLGDVRVVRGGSFLSKIDSHSQPLSDALRVSARDHEPGSAGLPDVGFRCVRYRSGIPR